MILKVENKPSSNIFFENLFSDSDIGCATRYYMLPRLVTYNTYMWSFQHKIVNNVLFLNKKLHIFGINSTSPCSFCNLYNETTFHIFCERDRVKCLRSNLVQCFQSTLLFPTLTPLNVIFEILDSVSNNSFFENNKDFVDHILLIFKLYVYKSREKKVININNLTAEIRKVIKIEK